MQSDTNQPGTIDGESTQIEVCADAWVRKQYWSSAFAGALAAPEVTIQTMCAIEKSALGAGEDFPIRWRLEFSPLFDLACRFVLPQGLRAC